MRSVMFFFYMNKMKRVRQIIPTFPLKDVVCLIVHLQSFFDSFESHSPSSNMKNGKYRKNERK